ncbi:MAG: VanZ family protein [Pseudomonadales bacterium]|nr:VanZ family protein [Pseudomonadales bacterium]
MSPVTIRYLARSYFVLALALISWLAFTSDTSAPVFMFWDKLNHAVAFFALAGLIDYAWRGYGWKWLFLIGYGLFIEAGQYLLGYRFFESADLIADGTGIAIYLLFRDTIPSLPMLDMLRQPLSDN